MTDLDPLLAAKLARLLPRMASDQPGEIAATAAAVGRVLARAGLDWHDLAAALTAPRSSASVETPEPRPEPAVAPGDGGSDDEDLRAMAEALRAVLDRLTKRQATFVRTASRLFAAGHTLTPRQAEWLRGLYTIYAEPAEGADD